MMIDKKKNLAGMMGADSYQPGSQMGVSTVDPIERMNQRVAGRTKGGKKKPLKAARLSIMNGGMRNGAS